jgi:pantoate--beta-alanine ligase
VITLLRKTNDLKSFLKDIPEGQRGIVPTMGNLHEGHLDLVRASIKDNPYTIVTIFVNPKQFGPNEDFDRYPRTLEDDINKLKGLSLGENKIIVYAPESNDEIYPTGFDTLIKVEKLTSILCGAKRPGHFDGVTTVVYQLFKHTGATNAYFGQKDYQQVKVVERMTKDLHLDVNIKMIPIRRDDDQMAMSSRNQYLTQETRKEGLELTHTVLNFAELLKTTSWLNAKDKINKRLEEVIKDERWDYLEFLDADNLQEVTPETKKVAILGALRLQKARLIDNRLVDITYA